jgi:CheY-like chemotaxis protein
MSCTTALVADDSKDIRTIINYSLSDLGFRVVEASNGYEAVSLARQCQPEVILLDLCMPGLDGWEVLSRLRSDPALEDVPIIVMTTYYASSTEQSARRDGCQHVLAKPFDICDLARVVMTFSASTDGPMPYNAR